MTSIRKPGRQLRLASLAILALLLGVVPAMADADREAWIKAAVIYKLAKFVEWPAARFERSDSPLRLCLFGESAINDALHAVSGRKVHDRALQVVAVSRQVDLKTCQVIFVAAAQQARQEEVIGKTAGEPVLSISDSETFAADGGTIALVRKGNRLGFSINLDAARAAGLEISAPLLELADVIDTGAGSKR